MNIKHKNTCQLASLLLLGVLLFQSIVPASDTVLPVLAGQMAEKEENQQSFSEKESAAKQAESKMILQEYPGVDEAEETSIPNASLLEGFEITYQMPELPTGCEITAMTMVLDHYGYDADKMTMALDYLSTLPADLYYGNDGMLYGPDLENYFVGDPQSSGGYVCGPGAIISAANSYLDDQGSNLRAVDRTGASPDELYRLVSEGTPVVVGVTISMEPRNETEGWYTQDGTYVEWSTNDHGAVLIGYTEDTVTIADPISGEIVYDREDFEAVFLSRGSKCVILE